MTTLVKMSLSDIASDQLYYQNIPMTPSAWIKDWEGLLTWQSGYYNVLAPVDSWKTLENCRYVLWKFSWDEQKLKKKGIYGFEGEMTFYILRETAYQPFHMKIKLTHSGQYFRKRIGTVEETNRVAYYNNYHNHYMSFQIKLDKITNPAELAISPDILEISMFCDAVLVVEGHKINVNKNQLSMCSDYFNTLFNSNFKEKSMDEIPIEDVKYQDFASLLGVIHPKNPTYPTNENASILLELADRFIMPAVTKNIENFLLNNSDISFTEILMLADRFHLEKLLDQSLIMFTTGEHVHCFKTSQAHSFLSDSAKLKLFDKFMTIP